MPSVPPSQELIDAFMSTVEQGDIKAVNAMLGSAPALAKAVQKTDPGRNVIINRAALHIAAEKGYIAVAEALLAAGAEIDAPNVSDTTPLMRAAEEARPDMVAFLLKKKANPNALAFGNATVLMSAVEIGCVECAKLLLDAGAKINAVMDNDGTALHGAVFAKFNAEDMVRYLIERGIDTNIPNDAGQTAADVARVLMKTSPHKERLAQIIDEYPAQYAASEAARQAKESFAAEINTAFQKGTAQIMPAPKRARFTAKNTL